MKWLIAASAAFLVLLFILLTPLFQQFTMDMALRKFEGLKTEITQAKVEIQKIYNDPMNLQKNRETVKRLSAIYQDRCAEITTVVRVYNTHAPLTGRTPLINPCI